MVVMQGSVCAMLEACLSSLPDKRVGVFTSPHVHTARERIRVNGQLMDKECVAPLVEKARAIVGCEVGGGKGFNFFDKLFLLALLYFEEKKVCPPSPILLLSTHSLECNC